MGCLNREINKFSHIDYKNPWMESNIYTPITDQWTNIYKYIYIFFF